MIRNMALNNKLLWSLYLYYYVKNIYFQNEYIWFCKSKSFIENSFELITTERTAVTQFTFFNRGQSSTNFGSSQVFKGMCGWVGFRNFFLKFDKDFIIDFVFPPLIKLFLVFPLQIVGRQTLVKHK